MKKIISLILLIVSINQLTANLDATEEKGIVDANTAAFQKLDDALTELLKASDADRAAAQAKVDAATDDVMKTNQAWIDFLARANKA